MMAIATAREAIGRAATAKRSVLLAENAAHLGCNGARLDRAQAACDGLYPLTFPGEEGEGLGV